MLDTVLGFEHSAETSWGEEQVINSKLYSILKIGKYYREKLGKERGRQ